MPSVLGTPPSRRLIVPNHDDRSAFSHSSRAAYITPQARRPFFEVMDAANVDLKGFIEEFYQKCTLSHLQPVLDTLRWLKHESEVWFEVTNLIIPRANDDPGELRRMCDWLLANVGGWRIAGRFDEAQGHWGRRRIPVRLSSSPRDWADE